ncbi:hypothetical protein GUA87_09610 [Sneathiella sp. P13V-1]|uniref:hypothetical protein n=1 Tax=Sneathiella sp. P13V-1 TaxID=2697366 RepID=UPI00187B86F6|nr:hypothetical protein [Sneathiella sp. P13V-1]MBE7637098.1 hypothetical protein [Sneathiella sp. P13V-1]
MATLVRQFELPDKDKRYKSVRIVGRGTVRVDPKEVLSSPKSKEARQLAKAIVQQHKTRAQ